MGAPVNRYQTFLLKSLLFLVSISFLDVCMRAELIAFVNFQYCLVCIKILLQQFYPVQAFQVHLFLEAISMFLISKVFLEFRRKSYSCYDGKILPFVLRHPYPQSKLDLQISVCN